MLRKRYFYVDGLLRHWVRLHARGVPPTAAELRAAAREVVGSAAPEPAPRSGAATPAARARSDSLMEID
jgi:hypothetical protein